MSWIYLKIRFVLLWPYRKIRYALGWLYWSSPRDIVHNYILRTPKPVIPRSHIISNIEDLKGSKTVVGASRICYAGDEAAFNVGTGFAAMLPNYLSQEEFNHRLDYDASTNSINALVYPSSFAPGSWVSICSPNSDNWMHWLTESLPIVARASIEYPKSGIILDRIIPPSARDSLNLLAKDRKMVELTLGAQFETERLEHIDSGWSLFWPRGEHQGTGIFKLDKEGLLLTRKLIFSALGITSSVKNKIFIKRNSHFRIFENQENLVTYLSKLDFQIIEPGDLTFVEQVSLFASAGIVIAQAGAALANIMFMAPGSKIVCLIADSPEINQDYFRDYASVFGVELNYFKGAPIDIHKYIDRAPGQKFHPMNVNFSCDIDTIMNLVNL